MNLARSELGGIGSEREALLGHAAPTRNARHQSGLAFKLAAHSSGGYSRASRVHSWKFLINTDGLLFASMEGFVPKTTIDRSRFTRKDLANVPLSTQEVGILAEKYNAASQKRWKYGIEIVDDVGKQPGSKTGSKARRRQRANSKPNEGEASKGDWAGLEGILSEDVASASARSSARSWNGTRKRGSGPAVSKKRCDCCQASFAKDSLKNCITMKSVLDLQRKWGIKHNKTRYSAGSYLYSKAYLCVFCLQFFQASPDSAKRAALVNDEESRGVQAVIQREHLSTVSANQKRINELREYNVACGKPAFMSSISDGLGAWLAVDGDADAEKNKCRRTRREYEAWWEVDLEDDFPIREIFLLCRTESSSYQMAPFWIMVCPTRQRGPRWRRRGRIRL